MKIVIVTGGREVGRYAGHGRTETSSTSAAWGRVGAVLTVLAPDLLIHGGCPSGVDAIAARWAAGRSLPCLVVPADWGAHGRAAGPRRNHQMADFGRILSSSAEVLVAAFPGGAGTANMVAHAEKQGLRVERFAW